MGIERNKVVVTGVVVLLSVVGVQAAIHHMEIPLPAMDIPAVDDYQTTGADMAGMEVTAFFTAAAPESVIWAATGVDAGEVVGPDNDWSLSQSGDTFNQLWTLVYVKGALVDKGLLSGFRIDGFTAGPGEVGVMFDRTFNGDFGTPDSFRGRDYVYVAGGEPPFDTVVTYENTIGVGGAAPVGDEFRHLDVRFLWLSGIGDEFTAAPVQVAGLDGENLWALQFRQDTNNPVVPEPSVSAILACAGLLALRRRRRSATR